MLRPSPEQKALLQGAERLSFAVCDFANRNAVAKRLGHMFLQQIGARWVRICTRNLMVARGLDRLASLFPGTPTRGVLLCANHRSFFDQYVLAQLLFQNTTLCKQAYFPVRSDFFYDKWVGLALNGIMSAWSMYPPVLRQPERNPFNRYAVDFLAERLGDPGTLVGFHPEGTRNKTSDPYTLLPAHPGVGQLVMKAHPIVIPAFINGLSNDLGEQIRGNFLRNGKPIIALFGEPLNLEEYLKKTARLRTFMEVSGAIREAIMALGAKEKLLRTELEQDGGAIGGGGPQVKTRWSA